MEINNLDQKEVDILESIISQMQKVNPMITCKTFIQVDGETGVEKVSTEGLLIELINKIDELTRKIDLIFGNHIFLNGQFKYLKNW